jgi:hypothetical protein
VSCDCRATDITGGCLSRASGGRVREGPRGSGRDRRHRQREMMMMMMMMMMMTMMMMMMMMMMVVVMMMVEPSDLVPHTNAAH